MQQQLILNIIVITAVVIGRHIRYTCMHSCVCVCHVCYQHHSQSVRHMPQTIYIFISPLIKLHCANCSSQRMPEDAWYGHMHSHTCVVVCMETYIYVCACLAYATTYFRSALHAIHSLMKDYLRIKPCARECLAQACRCPMHTCIYMYLHMRPHTHTRI